MPRPRQRRDRISLLEDFESGTTATRFLPLRLYYPPSHLPSLPALSPPTSSSSELSVGPSIEAVFAI